jgi:ribosome-associated protein
MAIAGPCHPALRGGKGTGGNPAGRRPWEDPYMPVRRPVDVPIREESIRLGQFLKLADLVEVGSDAKELISAGQVLVNGEPEARRGRQLRVGDVVELDGRSARVARRGSSPSATSGSARPS